MHGASKSIPSAHVRTHVRTHVCTHVYTQGNMFPEIGSRMAHGAQRATPPQPFTMGGTHACVHTRKK